jgi:hypothetical protein
MQDIEKDLEVKTSLDELKVPSEEARETFHEEEVKKFQEQYVASIIRHMQQGNMPRGMYNKLPKELKRRYRTKFVNAKGHIAGVPMNAQELERDRRVRRKRNKKRKLAKLARKANRR